MPKGDITPQQVMQQQAFQNIAGHLGNIFVPPSQQRQVQPVNPMLPLQMQVLQGQLGEQQRKADASKRWQEIMRNGGPLQTGTIEEVPTTDPLGIGEVAPANPSAPPVGIPTSPQQTSPLAGIPPGIKQQAIALEGFKPGAGAEYVAKWRMAQANKDPTATFNTVQDPFGRGGVGQRNSITGKIENYQKPKELSPRDQAFANLTPEQQRQVLLKPLVQTENKNVSDIDALLSNIDRANAMYEKTGDPKYKRRADALQMKLTFGGNPPESYTKAVRAINQTREGLSDVYKMLDKGSSSISPEDRAQMAQAFQSAKIGFAELTNRGANFTESEEKIVADILGGDPNDIVGRILRGDKSYKETVKKAGDIIEKYSGTIFDAYRTPGVGEYKYPWQQESGSENAPKGAPQPGVTEDGYRFKGGDPGDPNNWEKVR